MEAKQRVALVTGAAGGVGQSTVEKLAAEGCIVIGTDIRAIDGTPPEGVIYRQHDVTSEGDWQSLATWLEEEYGRLDILVNNAGIVTKLAMEDDDDVLLSSYHETMAVNLHAPLRLMRLAHRHMKSTTPSSSMDDDGRSSRRRR